MLLHSSVPVAAVSLKNALETFRGEKKTTKAEERQVDTVSESLSQGREGQVVL